MQSGSWFEGFLERRQTWIRVHEDRVEVGFGDLLRPIVVLLLVAAPTGEQIAKAADHQGTMARRRRALQHREDLVGELRAPEREQLDEDDCRLADRERVEQKPRPARLNVGDGPPGLARDDRAGRRLLESRQGHDLDVRRWSHAGWGLPAAHEHHVEG